MTDWLLLVMFIVFLLLSHITLPLCVIFSVQCLLEMLCDHHLVIAAILDVIMNFLHRWKTTTTTCQSNSPLTTAADNYQQIVIVVRK